MRLWIHILYVFISIYQLRTATLKKVEKSIAVKALTVK